MKISVQLLIRSKTTDKTKYFYFHERTAKFFHASNTKQPHKTGDFTFTLSPMQRGNRKGVLMFVCDDPLRPDAPAPSSDDDSEVDEATDNHESNHEEHPVFKVPNGTDADRKHGQKYDAVFYVRIMFV